MGSVAVTKRSKSAQFVSAAAVEHAPEIGGLLKEQLSDLVREGEQLPDFVFMFTLFGRYLDTNARTMEDADAKHLGEIREGVQERDARDKAVDESRGLLIDWRSLIDGLYGQGQCRFVLGLEGPTEEDPTGLLRQIQNVVAHIKNKNPVLPESRIKGVSVDLNQCATELDDVTVRLAKTLEAVSREREEAEESLLAKNRAIAAYDRGFSGVANTMRAFYEWMGQDAWAAKIRPSSRRRGMLEQVEQADVDEGDAAGLDSATPLDQA